MQYQPGSHRSVGWLSPGEAQYDPGVHGVHAALLAWPETVVPPQSITLSNGPRHDGNKILYASRQSRQKLYI